MSLGILDSRSGILGFLAVGSMLLLVGIGHWMRADFPQVLAGYSAILPLLAFLSILFSLDWFGETIVGSWGIWQARRDLFLLQQDLAALEQWRFGGRTGVLAFLMLFWASIAALAIFGFFFFFMTTCTLLRRHSAWLGTGEEMLDYSVLCLVLFWMIYAGFLLVWRSRHRFPPIPEEAVPGFASVFAWRKNRLLRDSEEAVAFLSLFQNACPEFLQPRGFPWKLLLFSLPGFCWHFYRWAGGQFSLPLAATATIGWFGAGAVLLSLWWLFPWSTAQTRALLHPERVSPCSYWPILRLRQLAQQILLP
ncbi:MAG: hypothetical protein AB7E44_02515 [Acidithiobacillus sp.]